ncbi:SCO family protein [Pseudooceanicola sediminis]|uniref:SCO family protein n=1 Tax=Pseudooceanicola sediminis TaxID=2211117 RepID=A0A399J4Q7_9RHOB|nr:SCO family protein [Pseudooceanicola sediminis]KAA2315469.1 SCO family protein [Puniceibacterium sp. HSS470]RII40324.1 SCO family protein [Pseudooceanicola sediminis]|tara:strand:- start:15361 stop:15993 length:633 start_codon:yes stop_codon:yes gene_type:complete
MLRLYAAAAVAAMVGLTGALWYSSRQGSEDAFAACRGSAVSGGSGQIGGPFELVDETGRTVTDADVITGPTLIYFGYTYCPDVCPMDMARNVQAVEILEQQGKDVTPVFISVDPARDTPDQLAQFTDYLHPRLLGLSGSDAQLKAASQAYRTYYKINPPEDPADEDYYLVDHSTFSYLMFPDLGFADFYRRNLSAEQLAEQMSCFIDAAS